MYLMHLDDVHIVKEEPPAIERDIKDFVVEDYRQPQATNVLYPELITENDLSDFLSLDYHNSIGYHNFISSFTNSEDILIKVSLYYSKEEATTIAFDYAQVIGRLPSLIRLNVRTLTLLEGHGHPSSGSYTITYVDLRINRLGVKEENLIHDFAHASLNGGIGLLAERKDEWEKAVMQDDGFFASEYAASVPWVEDVPETIIPYLITRWRPERFDPELVDFYNTKLKARFNILDSLNWSFNNE
jgi:hypothetical protein